MKRQAISWIIISLLFEYPKQKRRPQYDLKISSLKRTINKWIIMQWAWSFSRSKLFISIIFLFRDEIQGDGQKMKSSHWNEKRRVATTNTKIYWDFNNLDIFIVSSLPNNLCSETSQCFVDGSCASSLLLFKYLSYWCII